MMSGDDGAAAARKVRKLNWPASQQARERASEKIQPLQCGCEGRRTGIVLSAFIGSVIVC
jgi:hypothetical protein